MWVVNSQHSLIKSILAFVKKHVSDSMTSMWVKSWKGTPAWQFSKGLLLLTTAAKSPTVTVNRIWNNNGHDKKVREKNYWYRVKRGIQIILPWAYNMLIHFFTADSQICTTKEKMGKSFHSWDIFQFTKHAGAIISKNVFNNNSSLFRCIRDWH